ncbi:MAG: hypothetical protein A2Y54_08510 [Chloroflexi bacterium RBG_16_51_16]|jgi:hypothetical protein|nr:MAG: hypothetical protein A2Y54_08510 [Chloroflexi bacterium RBG_16_51_16]
MGRKGVSLRKPKKTRPFSNSDISGSLNLPAGERTLAQPLVKDKGALPYTGGKNPSADSNKKHKKGK